MAAPRLDILIRGRDRASAAFRSATRSGRGFGNEMRRVTAQLVGLGAALRVARGVVRLGDDWTRAANKINAASQVAGRTGDTLSRLTSLANESRAGFNDFTDLYARILRATKGVATSTEQVARATTIVSKAFKAGGASAQEQAAGLIQIGQALSSGFLQGDELRSIRENAPLVAAAIAREFETTIGGLKKLGAEGKLTSDRVFLALLKSQREVEAAFAETGPTMTDLGTRAENAMRKLLFNTEDGQKAMESLKDVVKDVIQLLEAPGAGTGFLGFVSRSVQGFSADLRRIIDEMRRQRPEGFLDNLQIPTKRDFGEGGSVAQSFDAVRKIFGRENAIRSPHGPDFVDNTVLLFNKVSKEQEKAMKAAAKLAARRQRQRIDLLKDLQREVSEIQNRTAALTLSTAAEARLEAQTKLTHDLKKKGIVLTTQQQDQFTKELDNIKAATQALEDQEKALERLRETAETVFSAMESAIDKFVETGKLNFSSLIKSIFNDLAKLALKRAILQPLRDMFNPKFSGSTGGSPFAGFGSVLSTVFGGFRANGGPVSPGKSFVVGEKGPEVFTPRTAGSIAPNGAMMGPIPITVINNNGSQIRATQDRSGINIEVLDEAVSGLMRDRRSNVAGAMSDVGAAPLVIRR